MGLMIPYILGSDGEDLIRCTSGIFNRNRMRSSRGLRHRIGMSTNDALHPSEATIIGKAGLKDGGGTLDRWEGGGRASNLDKSERSTSRVLQKNIAVRRR